MIEALRIPVEKLARRDLEDARRRVVSLAELLGRVPPLEEITAALLEGFREHLGLEPALGRGKRRTRSASRSASSRSSTAPTSSCARWMRRRSPRRCRRQRWCAARGRCAPTSVSKARRTSASAKRSSRAISSSARRARCSTWKRACAASPPPRPARRSRPSSPGAHASSSASRRPTSAKWWRARSRSCRSARRGGGCAATGAARGRRRRPRSCSCTTRWAASGCGAISRTSW